MARSVRPHVQSLALLPSSTYSCIVYTHRCEAQQRPEGGHAAQPPLIRGPFFFSAGANPWGGVVQERRSNTECSGWAGLASLLLIIGLAPDVPRSRSEHRGTCGSVEGKDDTTYLLMLSSRWREGSGGARQLWCCTSQPAPPWTRHRHPTHQKGEKLNAMSPHPSTVGCDDSHNQPSSVSECGTACVRHSLARAADSAQAILPPSLPLSPCP